jgi:hypothetical protein
MNCPNCNAAGPDDAAECASCGVIFAKWKASHEGKAQEAGQITSPTLARLEAAQSKTNPLLVLLLAAAAGLGAWDLLGGRQAADLPPSDVFDPEPFRAPITRIERELYKSDGMDLPELQKDLRKFGGQMSVLRLKKTAADLKALAAAVGAARQAPPPETRQGWTLGWEKIRSEVFLPCEWFHANTAYFPSDAPSRVGEQPPSEGLGPLPQAPSPPAEQPQTPPQEE